MKSISIVGFIEGKVNLSCLGLTAAIVPLESKSNVPVSYTHLPLPTILLV